MQKEITSIQPLHDDKGHLTNPGFAKKLYWTYDRNRIKAGKSRIKEWDYYLIHNDDYGIAFTIADNSYLGFVSVSLLNFKERKYDMFSTLIPFTWGKLGLPSSSKEGDIIFENKKE